MQVEKSLLKTLEDTALDIRIDIIDSLAQAQSGHSAGALGMADVFATLYFHAMQVDPQNPAAANRDRLVLSNGHICPGLYATLAHRGFFDRSELKKLRKFGSILEGHPNRLKTPGVEVSTGSLGQGLSVAIGMATAAKLNEHHHQIYCITGDGELNEGQIWEAAMYAGKKRLNNLTWIIDRNAIQQTGNTKDVLDTEPLKAKLEAFDLNVIEIDAHNFEEIISALNLAKAVKERASVIIANAVPGKGVAFMENKFEWHGKPPTKEQAKEAILHFKKIKKGLVK